MSIEDPTVAEAENLGRHYLEAAFQYADGNTSSAAATLTDYTDVEPADVFARLWSLAVAAPSITAAAVKKLDDDGRDGFWHIELDDDMPPDMRAAVQSTSYALNNDHAAVADIVAAHYRTAGGPTHPDDAAYALLDLVVEHLRLLAPLINAGAFTNEENA